MRVGTDGVVGQVKESVAAGTAGWLGGGKGKSVGVGVLPTSNYTMSVIALLMVVGSCLAAPLVAS